MAITYVENTPTIGSSIYSIPNNTTTSVPVSATTSGIYQLFLNLSALADDDDYELTVWEKIVAGGTQIKVGYPVRFIGPQAVVGPRFDLGFLKNGFDVTLQKLAGTDRAIPCSLRSAA